MVLGLPRPSVGKHRPALKCHRKSASAVSSELTSPSTKRKAQVLAHRWIFEIHPDSAFFENWLVVGCGSARVLCTPMGFRSRPRFCRPTPDRAIVLNCARANPNEP